MSQRHFGLDGGPGGASAVQRTVAAPLAIGLFVENFPVLSETFVINMAAGLVERGHKVRVFAMDGQRPAEPFMHATVERHGLSDALAKPFAGRLLIGPFQEVGAAWSPTRRAASFAAQAGMFLRARPLQIAHCQFATLGLALLRHLRLGTMRAKRLVVHLRGVDISEVVATHGPQHYAPLFERADLFIANCHYFRDKAIALGADPRKVIVIGSAVDCAQFALKSYVRPCAETLKLISVGRLVEKKGYEHAIRGVAEASRSLPGLSYDIIGEGPLREPLQRLIDALGMGGTIHLLGALPHEAVVEHLNAADLMLAVSVTAASGDQDAPVNSLKEAMAVGLPVIASRHGGLPELVEDRVHGALVPEADPSAVAAAIVELSRQRDRWPEMGRAGRQKVLAAYDMPWVTAQTIAAYETLLKPRETRP